MNFFCTAQTSTLIPVRRDVPIPDIIAALLQLEFLKSFLFAFLIFEIFDKIISDKSSTVVQWTPPSFL